MSDETRKAQEHETPDFPQQREDSPYAALNEQEAVAQAESIWAQINEPNLERNIRPTLGRASLVLRKGADHNVTGIRLRKV